jgi:hypothetical protein
LMMQYMAASSIAWRVMALFLACQPAFCRSLRGILFGLFFSMSCAPDRPPMKEPYRVLVAAGKHLQSWPGSID